MQQCLGEDYTRRRFERSPKIFAAKGRETMPPLRFRHCPQSPVTLEGKEEKGDPERPLSSPIRHFVFWPTLMASGQLFSYPLPLRGQVSSLLFWPEAVLGPVAGRARVKGAMVEVEEVLVALQGRGSAAAAEGMVRDFAYPRYPATGLSTIREERVPPFPFDPGSSELRKTKALASELGSKCSVANHVTSLSSSNLCLGSACVYCDGRVELCR